MCTTARRQRDRGVRSEWGLVGRGAGGAGGGGQSKLAQPTANATTMPPSTVRCEPAMDRPAGTSRTGLGPAEQNAADSISFSCPRRRSALRPHSPTTPAGPSSHPLHSMLHPRSCHFLTVASTSAFVRLRPQICAFPRSRSLCINAKPLSPFTRPEPSCAPPWHRATYKPSAPVISGTTVWHSLAPAPSFDLNNTPFQSHLL